MQMEEGGGGVVRWCLVKCEPEWPVVYIHLQVRSEARDGDKVCL